MELHLYLLLLLLFSSFKKYIYYRKCKHLRYPGILFFIVNMSHRKITAELLAGPVVSCVLIKCGCRRTTVAGAILATVALISSTYAPNLNVFILLYGALGGTALGDTWEYCSMGYWAVLL